MPRPRPDAETTATVLTTDVVGSTEARFRMGEVRADRHFSGLGGLLESVAAHTGAVFTRNLGDGVTAVFPAVAAALDAAVMMQRELMIDNRQAEEQTALRAGLSVGDVRWTDDDVDGIPLIEAARLCAMADGGQVLCTDLVRAMAVRREAYAFGDLGPRRAKGLPKPLYVHELLWTEVAPDSPLPAWTAGEHLLPMVGRTPEQAELRGELRNAERGTRHVHVRGEPGAGRTRLVSAIAEEAVERGFIVMAGRCHHPPLEAHEPIAAALDHLGSAWPLQLRRAGAAEQCLRLAHLALSLRQGYAEAEPISDRAQIVAALGTLIGKLAAIRPVLLLIDDLQWASAESLRILRALSWERPPRLLVLTTSRPISSRDPAAAELNRLAAESRCVDLRPLDGEAIAQLDLPYDSGQLWQVTGGNAFQVTEKVRDLASGQGLGSVPEPIKQSVAARLDRLGPQARQIAELLAVGNRLGADVLSAATGLDEQGLAEAVDELTAAGLVARGSGLRLQIPYELTEKAVYETLPTARAGSLHGRIADLLRELDPKTAESLPYVIAEHLWQATIMGHNIARARQAARAAAQAAEHAMARLAHHEAVTWYERLCHLTEEDTEQYAEALIDCGQAQWSAGDPRARTTLNEGARRARRCGRDDLLRAAAIKGDRGFFSITAEHDPDRVALLEEARRLGGDESTLAVLTAQLASELTWAPDGDRRFALGDQALDLARRSDDARALAVVLGLRSLTMVPRSSLEQRHREMEAMHAAARRTGDGLLLFHATFQRIAPYLDTCDTTEVARHLGRAAELAHDLAQPHLNWLVGFSEAGLSLMRGDLAEAEDRSLRARRLGAEIGRRHEATPFHLEQLAEIRRLQGRFAELHETFRAGIDLLEMDPVHSVLRYLCEAADPETEALLDRIVGRYGVVPREDIAHRPALDNLSLTAARLGRDDLTAPLYEALLPHAETFGHSAVMHHCGHHYLAHLAAANGHPEKAAAHFEAAAALHATRDIPLLAAESLLDWADLPDVPVPSDLRRRGAELLTSSEAHLLKRRAGAHD